MLNRVVLIAICILPLLAGCNREGAGTSNSPAAITSDASPSEAAEVVGTAPEEAVVLPPPETDLLSLENREVIMNENLDIALNIDGLDLPPNTFLAIVAADVPHDRGSIEEHKFRSAHLQRAKDGQLRLMAPGQPGLYEIRLYTGGKDGEVHGSLSFLVKDYDRTKVSIIPDGYRYPLGQDIVVRFEAPPEFAEKAWIGLIPDHIKDETSDENRTHAVRWSHLNGREKGELPLMAPEQPGSYDIRIFDSQNGGRVVTSVNIKIEKESE